MKIILEQTAETVPTFDEVDVNQFFVDKSGELCQKTTSVSFTVIADSDGKPYSDYHSGIAPARSIKKILPKVLKIEF